MRLCGAVASLTLSLLFPPRSQAVTLPELASSVLHADWPTTSLDRVVTMTGHGKWFRELSGALGENQNCTDVRVITVLERVDGPDCLRCLRFEFSPAAADTKRYELAAMILDYSTWDSNALHALLSRLMEEAGTSVRLELPKRKHETRWSDSWSSQGGERTLDIYIERSGRLLRLHFDHRRYPIPLPSKMPP